MLTRRERFANWVGGSDRQAEIQNIQESVKYMYDAFLSGPYQLQPEELVSQMRELDPGLLADVIDRMQYDVISGLGGTYGRDLGDARKRSIQESRRLWIYSPLAQWMIWTWTYYGLGEGVKIVLSDSDGEKIFSEMFEADRNASVFSDDNLQELSNWLGVNGEIFLACFASTLDGTMTVVEIDPDEMVGEVKNPNNKNQVVYWKRELENEKNEKKTIYYPDWRVFFDEPDLLDTVKLDDDAERAEKVREELIVDGVKSGGTVVCMLHIARNKKDRNSVRGWPVLTTAIPFIRSHQRFVEGRLTVAESKAMYVRRTEVKGGSRAVDAIASKISSNFPGLGGFDSNPPPTKGSTDIHNQAIKTTDLPMTTGASDAKTDHEMFVWEALLGGGLFPVTAGLDSSRWATALEMDKVQSVQWANYQTFWSSQLKIIVKITLKYALKYEAIKHENFDARVSIDSFSLVDFPDIATPLSQIIGSALTPYVQADVIDHDTARKMLSEMWFIVMQSLGIKDAEDITMSDTFGLGDSGGGETGDPADLEDKKPGDGADDKEEEEPEDGAPVEEMVEADKVETSGDPLPPVSEVVVTAEDVDVAMRLFDQNNPDDFTGLLNSVGVPE